MNTSRFQEGSGKIQETSTATFRGSVTTQQVLRGERSEVFTSGLDAESFGELRSQFSSVVGGTILLVIDGFNASRPLGSGVERSGDGIFGRVDGASLQSLSRVRDVISQQILGFTNKFAFEEVVRTLLEGESGSIVFIDGFLVNDRSLSDGNFRRQESETNTGNNNHSEDNQSDSSGVHSTVLLISLVDTLSGSILTALNVVGR
mmetsp:Transcript_21094/g.23866  ORF Transcript_21094/g.23866 Transcript_21094/m.23866 type:complete len:204 (+) Transcript_21094:575-1186(+)